MMIDLRQIKGAVELQNLVNQLNESYDAAKVKIDGGENVKAAVTRLTTGLAAKAEKTYVDQELGKKATKEELAQKADKTHKHANTEITGLGTAAVKNVGTGNGQIPVLNESGKLELSVIPSLAINDTFVVTSEEEALEKEVNVGDIVIIQSAVPGMHRAGAKDGTYIVVDADEEGFENRFRPLTSAADTMSRAEIESALGDKADKSQVTADISEAVEAAKEEINGTIGELNGRVEEVEGTLGELAPTIEAAKKIEKAKFFESTTARQTEFELGEAPAADRPIKAYVNGIKYSVGPDKDFTVSGTKITWNNKDFEIGEGFAVSVLYYV